MLSFIKRHQVILASVILCLVSLHLVSTTRKGTGGDVIVRSVLSVVTKPVQSTLIGIRSKVVGVWNGYIYLVGLSEENEGLRRTINQLVEENNRLKEELGLNARLKELLRFKDKTPVKTVAAEILGFSSFGPGGEWMRTLAINKGSGDGIKAGMPVVTPQGIVGRIVETNRFTSTVLLLTDPRSNIDVIIQRTRVKGVVEGDGSGGLILKYVRQLDDVIPGDRVVTAGLSTIFPKGLLVGEVVSVDKGEDNFFKRIELRPAADFRRLEEVLIVTGGGISMKQGKMEGTGAHEPFGRESGRKRRKPL